MSENHKIGDIIPFGLETYIIHSIEDGYIYMRNIKSERGQLKRMRIGLTPYFENGKLIVPERKIIPRKKYTSIVNISKIIREEHPDITLSRDFVSFSLCSVDELVFSIL